MDRRWFANDKDQASTRELLHSNKVFLDKMKEVCYTKIKELEKSRRNKPDYSKGDWLATQSDMNGYLRCLHDLTTLLNIED